MNIEEFIKRSYKPKRIEMHDRTVYEYTEIRPRVICNDGESVSVQGSRTHYSAPRCDGNRFYEVELGYPTFSDDRLIGYAEVPENPTDTVYGYVPVGIVQAVIDDHGGIDEEKTFMQKRDEKEN